MNPFFLRLLGALPLALLPGIASAAVYVNEFMALNPGRPNDPDALLDMDGDSPGWIELRNDGAEAVDLTGWALTDNPALPAKFVFAAPVPPATTPTRIAAGGYLLVYCSEKPRNFATVEPHALFKIDDTGFLQLSQPDGASGWISVSAMGTPPSAPYPLQRPGVSFGRPGNDPSAAAVYFLNDSPGAGNASAGETAFVEDTKFDAERGYHTAAFPLTITSATPGATIVYTVNGSVPTLTNGTVVAAANDSAEGKAVVNISGTTVIRTRAFKTGLAPTNTDTRTFLFPAQVLTQTGPVPSMGLGTHTRGVTNPLPANLPAGAASLNPSVPWGFTSENGFLHDFATNNGPDWAVDPDIVNHGQVANRFTAADLMAIPTMSLVTDWKGLFGPNSPGQLDGGIYSPAAGIAEEGVRRTASVELINPDGPATGPEARDGFQVDGRFHIFGGTSQGRWRCYKLSMNFKCETDVDYNVYGGDASREHDRFILDARSNQSWVHADATQRARGDYTRDHVVADLQHDLGGLAFHAKPVHLFLNGIYWGLYILHDRPDHQTAANYLGGPAEEYDVFKHSALVGLAGSNRFGNVINTGAVDWALPITENNATVFSRFEELLDTVGIGAEGANPTPDLTVRANYEAAAAKVDIPQFIDYIILNWVAGNTDWPGKNLYASSRRAGPDQRWRWHTWDAEHVFRETVQPMPAQVDNRGPVAIHNRLKLNREYRMRFADALQRRLFDGGALSTPAVRAAFTRRLDEIDGAIRGESARWGDNRTPTTPLTRANWLTERARLVNAVVPARTSVAPAVSTSALGQFRLDGLYPTLPGTGTSAFTGPAFQDAATGAAKRGGEVTAGFALKIVNTNSSSSGANAVLYTLDSTDPREAWTGLTNFSGNTAAGALTWSNAVPLTASATVSARIRNTATNGTVTWSPLTRATFTVDTAAASAENLVVSKIHYHPSKPTTKEAAAGFTEDSLFEFIELMNVSASRVRLDGVRFTGGIDFVFDETSAVRELAPGGRVLVVADPAAFRRRFGPDLPVAGGFLLGTNLADSGEPVSLTAADGTTVIKEFAYDDKYPWPEAADGDGACLVLRHPRINTASQAHNQPENWRASGEVEETNPDAGARPGRDDRLTFAGWRNRQTALEESDRAADADPDGDRLPNLLEYALGRDPAVPTHDAPLEPEGMLDEADGPHAAVSFVRAAAAEDGVWRCEVSADLTDWETSAVLIGGIEAIGGGLEKLTFLSPEPVSAKSKLYFRLRYTTP